MYSKHFSLKAASLCVIAVMSLMTACDIHTSNNGSLDGFWQLAQADTLSADNPAGRSADVRAKGIFWAVQADLLEIKDLHDKRIDTTYLHHSVFFRFTHEAGRLHLFNPSVDQRYAVPEYPDAEVDDLSLLEYYGLQSKDETFDVLQLDGDRMVLQGEHFRFHFRKY